MEDEEELFAEHAGESQGDVPKEDVCGSAQVMFTVEDVGGEGVGGVEGLPTRLAGSLGGGEEVALVNFALEFEERVSNIYMHADGGTIFSWARKSSSSSMCCAFMPSISDFRR